MRREGRESLPDHSGESPLLSRSGGEKGLRGSGAGTLGVPLGGTLRVGGLLGVAGRLSGTVSPFRAEQEKLRETWLNELCFHILAYARPTEKTEMDLCVIISHLQMIIRRKQRKYKIECIG